MNYNLISDEWITVKDFKSIIKKIKPEQIADPQWETLDAPRADLKGALFQFMIGLLQTAFAPEDREQWEEYWETPPSEEILGKAFERFHHAFYLNAENKPAFMQDFDLPDDAKTEPIERLLIGSASENSFGENTDLFVKRESILGCTSHWAALSLFTLQISTPGNSGLHRGGIRGGGPLTTLVFPSNINKKNTLWRKLWLNVLTKEDMAYVSGNSELNDDRYIFPWLGAIRTSEKKGMETLPAHANPLQMYWCMPRRIQINWEQIKSGVCDISGEQVDNLVTEYKTIKQGIQYSGYWMHPLSAYTVDPKKVPVSVKPNPGGIDYRHWLGLVVKDDEKHKQPALIVRNYEKWRCDVIGGHAEAQLWAFGYDIDKGKIRCWYEARMPVFHLSESQLSELSYQIPKMIEAANDSLKTLRKSLKTAWFRDPEKNKQAKGKEFNKKTIFLDHSFWQQTESSFYKQLRLLINQLNDESAIKAVLNEWRKSLKAEAVKIFDDYVLSSLNEDGDMKRIIKARKYLEKWLNISKPMKSLKVA